jgi:hypothetical protein
MEKRWRGPTAGWSDNTSIEGAVRCLACGGEHFIVDFDGEEWSCEFCDSDGWMTPESQKYYEEHQPSWA